MTDPQDPETVERLAPIRAAPLHLWRFAERFMCELFALFGDAGDVARRHTLMRPAHALMARWLAAGEALLRRLLLIEAQYIQLEPAKARTPGKRVRQLVLFDPETPEKWRVHFQCAPSADANHHAHCAHGKCGSARRFCSAWPLALRLEALLRVFNNPMPYAKRLARRLARDEGCLDRVLKIAPALRPIAGEDALAELESHAEPPAYANSS